MRGDSPTQMKNYRIFQVVIGVVEERKPDPGKTQRPLRLRQNNKGAVVGFELKEGAGHTGLCRLLKRLWETTGDFKEQSDTM